MDQSANFMRQAASGLWKQYADELCDSGQKLQQEIMANTKSELGGPLSEALDKIIKRKVEDFELGIMEGREMTQNTVNIINSSISNALVQITQSGKDAISKDTAQKLQELVNSEEIKGLPEDDRLHGLDQVDDLIKELQAPTTDKGKVHRGLKRLGNFISLVASNALAQIVTKLATAWASS